MNYIVLYALKSFLLSYSLMSFVRFSFNDYIRVCTCLDINKISLSLSLYAASDEKQGVQRCSASCKIPSDLRAEVRQLRVSLR